MDDIQESVDTSSDSVSAPESAAPVTQSAQTSTENGNAGSSPTQDVKEERIPYSRFAEVVNQKNEYALKMSELEKNFQRQMYEMQARMNEFQNKIPANKPAENPALNILKEANPEVANYIKSLEDKIEKMASYEDRFTKYDSWIQNTQETQAQKQTETEVNNLYDKYKVPEDQRTFVRSMLNDLAMKNPDAPLSALEGYFKQAVDGVQKVFSSYERKKMQEYIVDKKKDNVPATTTGGAIPKQGGNKLGSKADRMNFIAEGLRAAKQQI